MAGVPADIAAAAPTTALTHVINQTAFTASAQGRIGNTAAAAAGYDAWSITEAKVLTNNKQGLP